MLESNNFKNMLTNHISNQKKVTQFVNDDPNITNVYPVHSNNKPITLQSLEMKKCAVL